MMNNFINQKIDLLLDNFEFKIEKINFIIDALKDHNREIRQSALLLLSEFNLDITKEAIYNHLPFFQMTCLDTISNEGNDLSEYFTIADCDNAIFGHWDVDYKRSYLFIWDMANGLFKKEI